MTVGLLYPRSGVHPTIGADWIDGLKLFIRERLPDADLCLLMESIGFGGAEKEVYEKAEKLLLIEKADVLVAFIDLKVQAILEPLLYNTGKLMIVVNPGANYPHNWVPQPNIIYLSLHHAFLCRLAGSLAAQLPVANAATATTFYDCGYLHTATMINGFTQYGGNITFNYINNQQQNTAFEIGSLTDFLLHNPSTGKLLCTFDSQPASHLYTLLNGYRSADNLQLFVSPMMLEEKALYDFEQFHFSLTGYSPWMSSVSDNDNKEFTHSFNSFSRKQANIFSLLGWETGLILQQILLLGNRTTDGGTIAEQLKQMPLQSPRGAMHLDAETHYYLSPAVQCTVSKGKLYKEMISIERMRQQWSSFIAQPLEGISSGWTNTYLCY